MIKYRLINNFSLAADDVPPGGGLGQMFTDPNLLGKLALNPRTKKYLDDPAFVQKVGLKKPRCTNRL
jgi:hypothetical protein